MFASAIYIDKFRRILLRQFYVWLYVKLCVDDCYANDAHYDKIQNNILIVFGPNNRVCMGGGDSAEREDKN